MGAHYGLGCGQSKHDKRLPVACCQRSAAFLGERISAGVLRTNLACRGTSWWPGERRPPERAIGDR